MPASAYKVGVVWTPGAPSHGSPPPSYHVTFVEAENLTVVKGNAEARDWSHSANYYAMTVANSFHSRRAYLHLGGPNATTGQNVASATLRVAKDDDYHVLVRYEAPYRFEVPSQDPGSKDSSTTYVHMVANSETPRRSTRIQTAGPPYGAPLLSKSGPLRWLFTSYSTQCASRGPET